MKKTILFLLICILFKSSYGQNSIAERNDLIKDKVLFLTFESPNLKFFPTGKFAGREPLKNNHTFALKGNFSNVYINWLNPLKYNISWKDTVYTDERVQIVNDYLASFVGQGDLKLKSGQTQEILSQIKPMAVDSKKQIIRLYGVDDNSFNGYGNLELLNLYLELRDKEDSFSQTEIELQLNPILSELDKLDALSYTNISNEVDQLFIQLFSIEKSEEVKSEISLANDKIIGWESTFSFIDNSVLEVKILMRKLNFSTKNKIIELYFNLVVSNFLTSTSENVIKNRELVKKIVPVKDILDKSIKNELDIQKGYFLNRSVAFSDGKMLETDITITELEFQKETKVFSKKSSVYSSKIKFRRFDWVIPVVSTGIFYSNATLSNFGFSTDSTGTMTITEDINNKNTAVTALFLNLNFDIDSRFFSPLIQLGIDPTKQKPYIMLGGGFAIPVAKFGITGGGIWTWDASLNSLSVGSKITSTTELDNNIAYQFDIKPKGWYLGIQYNF